MSAQTCLLQKYKNIRNLVSKFHQTMREFSSAFLNTVFTATPKECKKLSIIFR